MRVTTIGAGYVGSVTAVGLARLGHDVDLVAPEPLAAVRETRPAAQVGSGQG